MAFLLASSSLLRAHMQQQTDHHHHDGDGDGDNNEAQQPAPGEVLCECLRTCLLQPEWCRECSLPAADDDDESDTTAKPSDLARSFAKRILFSHEALVQECLNVLHEAMATSMTQQEIEECADAMAVRVLAAEEELEASAPPSLFGPSGSRHEAEERLHALVERHLDLRLLELGYYLSINLLRVGRDDEEAVAAD